MFLRPTLLESCRTDNLNNNIKAVIEVLVLPVKAEALL